MVNFLYSADGFVLESDLFLKLDVLFILVKYPLKLVLTFILTFYP